MEDYSEWDWLRYYIRDASDHYGLASELEKVVDKMEAMEKRIQDLESK